MKWILSSKFGQYINCLRKIYPIIILFIAAFVFYWQFFIKGLIPFPGDMLVGAYYPWIDYRWGGYVTSVPIKNPLISDVFSQIYLWKMLIANSFKNSQFPLWNPFSYSGYPLLANFQSGVFNPFNIFMIVFGQESGWSLMMFSQSFFASLSMYIFLKTFHQNKISRLSGAITYGFSAYLIAWSQFATVGFAMIWIPLILACIELFFQTKKIIYLLLLSPIYFLLMSAGHFQALVYGYIFSGMYFVWKYFKNPNFRYLKIYIFSVLISFGLMAIQIFPTLEFGKNSIRFSEEYISHYNYGLLSLDKIITLFSPDYFGNPTTANYWGTFNYQETIVYVGIFAVFALLFSIYQYKILKNEKFFLIVSLLCLLLSFDTTFGRLIYKFNVPGLSTSAAGRIIIIFTFCLSVLISYMFEYIKVLDLKKIIRYYWSYILFLAIIILYTLITYHYTSGYPDLQLDYKIAIRNLFLPVIFSVSIVGVLILLKNLQLKRTFLLIIVILDLFRFGWKYTPFVNKEYVFPKTDLISFLQEQKGYFRIEKEKGPLLPPNTWTAYGLMSTAGYDPMAVNDYSYFYDQYINQSKDPHVSRYSETEKYDSNALGEANVKYLLALKYSDDNRISKEGTHINTKINSHDWEKVSEKDSVVVLENKNFKPRAEILNDKLSKAEITTYFPQKVIVNYTSATDSSKLVLRDTYYPGWKAYLNNKELPINKYLGVYKEVAVPKGSNTVEFIYSPDSFKIGYTIHIICLILWIFITVKFWKYKI